MTMSVIVYLMNGYLWKKITNITELKLYLKSNTDLFSANYVQIIYTDYFYYIDNKVANIWNSYLMGTLL